MNNSITGKIGEFSDTLSKNYLILFIIWPLLALIVAMANYSQKVSKRVVYFFLVYYGLSFVMTNMGADAEEYARRLAINATLPFSDIWQIIGGIYATDTSVDIVEPIISFVVSRFTSHYVVYFAIWAAIFGYFYLRSINLLHNQYRKAPGWNTAILLGFFAITIPITSMNGPRMWTASWVFFLGAYQVIVNRDLRYFFMIYGASLVHFSFLSASIVLTIYYFIGNRNYLYLPLVILSFVLPNILGSLFELASVKLGGGFQSRFDTYTSEDLLLTRQDLYERSHWFIKISSSLLLYYFLFVIAYIKLRFGSLMKGKTESSIYSFLLLFLAFVNFGKTIPSFGSRFQIIFYIFATVYLFLFFLKQPGNKISPLILLGLFPMLLFFAITFRVGSDSINAWIFVPGFGISMFVPGISIGGLLF
jgi:hypothetical protein